MERNSGDWTIVIIGGWNLSIFQPDWVANKLFEIEEVKVSVTLASGVSQFQFIHDGISLVVNPGNLTLSCENLDNDTIIKCEDYAKKIADLLPHTPVRAIGFNSGYIVEEPSDYMTNSFSLNDTAALIEIGEATISETSIRRQLLMGDKIVNFKILEKDTNFIFKINHHIDINSTEEIKNFADNYYLSFNNNMTEVIEEIYKVELNQEE